MAAPAKQLNQNLFGKDELADEAEVERLETEAAPAEAQPPEQKPPAEKPQEEAKLLDGTRPDEHPVPYERVKQLIETNKAYERELTEAREFRTRLDERQRLIKEASDQQAKVVEEQRRAAERPDPSLDPIGAELYDLRAERVRDRQAIEQLQGQLNNFGQTYQNNQEQQVFSGWVTNEANTYAATDPHYFPAAKYAADKRINFWRSVAPNAPAGVAEKLVEGESILIARLAQQYGGRFAPAVAQLAREWGFNPQPQVNGQMRSPQGPPQAGASPQAQRLAQVQNGQRLQGLGAVPAGNNAAESASAYRNYSKVDIANMSEREFMQAMANPQTARDLKYALAKADDLEGEVNY